MHEMSLVQALLTQLASLAAEHNKKGLLPSLSISARSPGW